MNARLPETSSIPERIARLRDAMKREGLAAWLAPSADPHLSEYLPGRWQARQWLSGFTGSAGTLVVTDAFAGVWTDSRYWEQAEAQLAGTGVQLMKMPGGQQSLPHFDWLAQNVPAGASVGVDGAVLGVAAARVLIQALDARGVRLRTDLDLLDGLWPGRPSLPAEPVFEHAVSYAGVTRADKLAAVRRAMQDKGAQWHFVSTLDDLAWLLNLRGADVSYNPVFVAHALIGPHGVSLFVAEGKVPGPLAEALARDGVRIEPYAGAAAALAALPGGATLLVDPRRVTFGLLQSVPSAVTIVEAVNPSTLLKSRKSEADAAHVRATMEQDGAALAEFFAWFEQALGRETITELTIDARLSAARMRRPDFVSPSFATIAGFNANGAMPHYRATPESHAVIEGDGLLLIDSGAQYLGGTTDITRMVPVGRLGDAQRRAVSARHPLADARRDCPRADLGSGHRLRPWDRPRRRLLPERARRSAGDLALCAGRAVDGDGGGDDHIRRAGHLPPRTMGRAHRESGAESRGGEHRLRRFPRVRDPHAVSDRYALHRRVAAARGRARVAERVSRDGSRARLAARVGRRAGVARHPHASALRPH